MARNRLHGQGDDDLERRVRASSAPTPPADLANRCLETIPRDESLLSQAAAWLKGAKQKSSSNGHAKVLSMATGGRNREEAAGPANGHRQQLRNRSGQRWPRGQRWHLPVAAAASLLLVAGLSVYLLAPVEPGGNPIVENNTPVVVDQPDSPQPPAVRNDAVVQNNTPDQGAQPSPQRPERPALVVPEPGELAGVEPPSDTGKLIEAQLAAGEFAPALQTVKQINSVQLRDHYLAQVAMAQAANGQLPSALDTTRSMSDDRNRASALQGISNYAGGPLRGAGGAAQADFDSLIDLVTSTVAPQTWDEVGGRGSVQPFPTGVYIDAAGVLRRQMKVDAARRLVQMREDALRATDNRDVRKDSSLRKISLTRLERELQIRQAAGLPIDDDMRHLAGLSKIEYIMIYPETGDLVIAGPAGDWHHNDEGRMVGRTSGRPVVQLDDLVVLLRQIHQHPDAPFGCLIEPRQKNLAKFKDFSEATGKKVLPATKEARENRTKELAEALGRQDIRFFGGMEADGFANTRVAKVLVEADYHMKLVGIGLEEGTLNVPSCMDLFKDKVKAGGAPPALDVLRLWFTLNYDSVLASADEDAFQLRGPAVQVLSELQFLKEHGERVGTGQSDPLYVEFASKFSSHINELSKRYPLYADLQNICDLAMVAALIEARGLGDQVNWHRTYFGDQHQVATSYVPREVDTVANHVEVSRKEIVFVVSGGVRVHPGEMLTRAGGIQTDRQGVLNTSRRTSAPGYAKPLARDAWWWD